jgi:hypothetical protein
LAIERSGLAGNKSLSWDDFSSRWMGADKRELLAENSGNQTWLTDDECRFPEVFV